MAQLSFGSTSLWKISNFFFRLVDCVAGAVSSGHLPMVRNHHSHTVSSSLEAGRSLFCVLSWAFHKGGNFDWFGPIILSHICVLGKLICFLLSCWTEIFGIFWFVN